MPREPFAARSARAAALLDRLDRAIPDAKIQLDYRTPLELLAAVMLSAQCTDVRVNLVTPALFRRFPTAIAYARARPREVEALIRTCGLFRSKARNLIAAARTLIAQHGGEVPTTRELLETLPGVGRKTAGVVSNHLGSDSAFPVDTHVGRLAFRMGLTRHTHPDKVELDLRALLPQPSWAKGHQLLIWHGRRVCSARAPACDTCPVKALCPRCGVPLKPRRKHPKPARP
jgi:endonuclease-3